MWRKSVRNAVNLNEFVYNYRTAKIYLINKTCFVIYMQVYWQSCPSWKGVWSQSNIVNIQLTLMERVWYIVHCQHQQVLLVMFSCISTAYVCSGVSTWQCRLQSFNSTMPHCFQEKLLLSSYVQQYTTKLYLNWNTLWTFCSPSKCIFVLVQCILGVTFDVTEL